MSEVDYQPDSVKEEKKSSVGKSILGWVIYILVLIIVVIGVNRFLIRQVFVDGNSMKNTLHDKERLIVDEISYRFNEPKRFDIIVFDPYENDPDTHYIKRIIGLPGETVQIKDSVIYINGEPLEENYGRQKIEDPYDAAEPISLGKDEYFVLGDNRNYSTDSRDPDVGKVKADTIMGKAWVRIWPFSKFGLIKH